MTIDLTAARALAAAADKAAEGATEGPWKWETVRTSCGVCHKIGPWPHKWRHGQETSACIYDDYPSPAEGTDTMLANARFIAASRQLVPDMAATIRALCAEVERLREALRFYADVADYVAPYTGAMGKLWRDCGETARAALLEQPK